MFGYVTASWKELDKQQRKRYTAVYCGICRCIRKDATDLARLGLSYDMAFLALLLMSLYEPEETGGPMACRLHPIAKRAWVESDCVRYAADMNVILTYYKSLDDWRDEKKHTARLLAKHLKPSVDRLREEYPRQYAAISQGVEELSALEREGCQNPDEPAGAFGRLMGELLVYKEDLWAQDLRQMGLHLGRFIYLRDASEDYDRDLQKGRYNPFVAMGGGKQARRWEEYLVLAMAACTQSYEKLPLVQDKGLLDNILYSGVWLGPKRKSAQEENP